MRYARLLVIPLLFLFFTFNVHAAVETIRFASECYKAGAIEDKCTFCNTIHDAMKQNVGDNYSVYFKYDTNGADVDPSGHPGAKWQCGFDKPIPISQEIKIPTNSDPTGFFTYIKIADPINPDPLMQPAPGGLSAEPTSYEACIAAGTFPSTCLQKFGNPDYVSTPAQCAGTLPAGTNRDTCSTCVKSTTPAGQIFDPTNLKCLTPGTGDFCNVRYSETSLKGKCDACVSDNGKAYSIGSDSCVDAARLKSNAAATSYCDKNFDGTAACYECVATGGKYNTSGGCEIGDPVRTGPLNNGSKAVRGVTCGIPEEDTQGNFQKQYAYCCNVDLNSEDQQLQMLNTVPEYFCLPATIGKIGGGIAGIFGDIVDTVAAPIRAANSLVHGRYKNAFGNLASTFLPDKVAKGIKNGGDICLSDIPNRLSQVVLGVVPFNRVNQFNPQDKETDPTEIKRLMCKEGSMSNTTDSADPSCRCAYETAASKLCDKYIKDPGEKDLCEQCTFDNNGVWTGLGCIKSGYSGFINTLLSAGIGLAGGVAFLCILYASILLTMSRGNPERIKKAREYLNSCIIGLLIVIFSLFILQLVGVNILGLPGLS